MPRFLIVIRGISVRRGPDNPFFVTLKIWSCLDSLAPNNWGCFWFHVRLIVFNFHCCKIRFSHLELYLRIVRILVGIFAHRSGWNVSGRRHEVEPMLSSNVLILICELRRLFLRAMKVTIFRAKCSRIDNWCRTRPPSFASSWKFHRHGYTFPLLNVFVTTK